MGGDRGGNYTDSLRLHEGKEMGFILVYVKLSVKMIHSSLLFMVLTTLSFMLHI